MGLITFKNTFLKINKHIVIDDKTPNINVTISNSSPIYYSENFTLTIKII